MTAIGEIWLMVTMPAVSAVPTRLPASTSRTPASRNRRNDARVIQIDLRGRDRALIDHHGAFELVDQRGLRVDVQGGDGVLLFQLAIAGELEARDVELCLIPAQGTPGPASKWRGTGRGRFRR